jgi:peroxiredoxin
MPSIQALHDAYGPSGLKVVAVSIDDPGTDKAVRAFAKELGLTFEILHDPTGAIQKSYQTTGVPETFVLGPDGTIRKKVIGAADWNSPANRALVEQLLADARRYAHQ